MDSPHVDIKTEKEDINLTGGILIIGSLLWDTDEQRAVWRDTCLRVANQITVPAPIRYGRVSTQRNCTFSMVFSNDCNANDKQGKGVFVPFQNNPINFENLKLQTQLLIQSERKKENLGSDNFNWDWGALGISVNPEILREDSDKFNQSKLLLSYWGKKYSKGFEPEQYKVGNETSILTKMGVLSFVWPKNLKDFDFIIATATKPQRDSYPTSKNIADRMLVNEYSEYFLRNVELGISTFQDKEIAQLLSERNE